jgi:hypothetical protein
MLATNMIPQFAFLAPPAATATLITGQQFVRGFTMATAAAPQDNVAMGDVDSGEVCKITIRRVTKYDFKSVVTLFRVSADKTLYKTVP